MTRSGRAIVLGILSLFAALASSGTSASAFSLDDVAVRAQKLASASYQKPSGGLPKAIKALDYGKNKISRDEVRDAGFAGFRVHFPLNTAAYKDEALVFLGASYFRALGRGQRYGLSARGLAIDTAESTGEEFPRFVEYWLERPEANAKRLIIYALLDSPRATGAYRFVLTPGVTTVLD